MKYLILRTAIAFAVLGFLFSSRTVILTLNSLTPIQGLLIYYLEIFLTLEFLQWIGLVVGGIQMRNLLQTLGELFIIFAFFIIVDFESAWIAYVVGEDKGKKVDYPVLYTQAEDGAVYYLWSTYVTSDSEKARILTYVVTPALLVSLGLYLTGGKRIHRELLG